MKIPVTGSGQHSRDTYNAAHWGFSLVVLSAPRWWLPDTKSV